MIAPVPPPDPKDSRINELWTLLLYAHQMQFQRMCLCPHCVHPMHLNVQRHYECESCHKQFVTSPDQQPAGAKMYEGVVPASEEVIYLVELNETGNGHFFIQKSITNILTELNTLSPHEGTRT